MKINKNTVARKFLFLGKVSQQQLTSWNQSFAPSQEIQFDDLETFEHTKLKPLSVTLAVESGTRRMLGFQISVMPPKGTTIYKALKKYGPRKDERSKGRIKLLKNLKPLIHETACIKTDENPHYVNDIKFHFPKALHIGFKGQRGSSTGQGELKQIIWDPLFSLNHTCAKLRADVCRLIRKTWSTTKKKECLGYHLSIFALYHNQNLKKIWN